MGCRLWAGILILTPLFAQEDCEFFGPKHDHFVSRLQSRQHRSLLFLLALHRHEHQEIENRHDEDQGQEAHNRIGRGLLLKPKGKSNIRTPFHVIFFSPVSPLN